MLNEICIIFNCLLMTYEKGFTTALDQTLNHASETKISKGDYKGGSNINLRLPLQFYRGNLNQLHIVGLIQMTSIIEGSMRMPVH